MADSMTIEQKIALILKKAETATPAEAEMLTERAAVLMQRYAIDEAMLNATRLGGERETPTTEWIEISGIYVKAWTSMAAAIGPHMNLRMLHSGSGKTQYVIAVGFPKDIALFKTMFTSLQLQAMVAMREWWNVHPYKAIFTGSEAYQARRTFIVGFGDGAASVMRKTYAAAKTEAGSKNAGTELVLVNRKQEVDTYLGQQFPRLRRGRGMKMGSGYGDGHAAGKNANVGTNRTGVTSGRKAVGR